MVEMDLIALKVDQPDRKNSDEQLEVHGTNKGLFRNQELENYIQKIAADINLETDRDQESEIIRIDRLLETESSEYSQKFNDLEELSTSVRNASRNYPQDDHIPSFRSVGPEVGSKIFDPQGSTK